MKKIHFVSSSKVKAQKIYDDICDIYTNYPVEESDVIACIGGDGFILYAMKKYCNYNLPFYGINAGFIGFLMNNFQEGEYSNLINNIENAEQIIIHPLICNIVDRFGCKYQEMAINEIALNRQSARMLRIKIQINGINQSKEVKCDGIIVSTPMGSTAYNLSAGGRIVPLSSSIMTLTPVASFLPLNWKGLIIPNTMTIECDVLEEDNRRCKIVADNQEVRNIKSAEVFTDISKVIVLLYNADDTLISRNIKKQFMI